MVDGEQSLKKRRIDVKEEDDDDTEVKIEDDDDSRRFHVLDEATYDMSDSDQGTDFLSIIHLYNIYTAWRDNHFLKIINIIAYVFISSPIMHVYYTCGFFCICLPPLNTATAITRL